MTALNEMFIFKFIFKEEDMEYHKICQFESLLSNFESCKFCLHSSEY